MNTVVATGLDGKPSIWPVNAVSRDKTGVFRDIKGRVVGGVAMDAAPKGSDDTVQAKIQRAKRIVARNAEDDAAIRKLFPSLLAAAKDDAESEQASFDEDSPDNEVEGASYEDTLKATVDYWNNVKRQNSQRAYAKSSGVYQPVPTTVPNKAKAADGNSVAVNARRAKGYSLFNSGTRITKLSNQRASL